MKFKTLTFILIAIIILSPIFNFTKTSASAAPEIANGAVYRFKNASSTKYLNVGQGIDANGTNVYQYSEDGSTEQTFKVIYESSSDSYKIATMCSSSGNNRVLDIKKGDGVISEGDNIQIYTPTDPAAQRWKIVHLENSKFKIVSNANTSLALTSYGASNGTLSGTAPNSAGNVYLSSYSGAENQQWYIQMHTPVAAISSGTYYIKNPTSGKYLDVTNAGTINGTKIIQYGFSGGANQRCRVTYQNNGTYKIFPIHALNSKIIDIKYDATSLLNQAVLQDNATSNSNIFAISPSTSSTYNILTKNSNYLKAIDIRGGIGGVEIIEYPLFQQTNQQWQFIPVNNIEQNKSQINETVKVLGFADVGWITFTITRTYSENYNLSFDGNNCSFFKRGISHSVRASKPNYDIPNDVSFYQEGIAHIDNSGNEIKRFAMTRVESIGPSNVWRSGAYENYEIQTYPWNNANKASLSFRITAPGIIPFPFYETSYVNLLS